ncbi:hypothetical protein [Actinomycetospora lemnae]|uniref:Caspase domain-containing protein n=1 Tax=Actinomycetospora lemnae TaxID=3019891 RepID=A0ABT5SZN3_9PSEU|nr:hypothetical protein [Actinomycetospora sp. DW7H6]MDD7967173.1 hypothetical protein [Actinomycetospora sp. DW7H6]
MATIRGSVTYNEGTPAAGAAVRVHEDDDATADDRSARRTVRADGTYTVSLDWSDEGPLELPRFRFTASADGRNHAGPLFVFGGLAAPIVLPFPPPQPVKKSTRDLVQVILLSKDYEGAERALYEFIEVSTETLTSTMLGDDYREVTFVKGEDATLQGVVATLDAVAARSGTRAVDLIFSSHGFTDRMLFWDGKKSGRAVRDAFGDIADDRRAKFRALFSTACIGHTHTDDWRAIGFTEAMGSKGIYADSAVSYAPMLSAWAGGRTFGESVDAANAADVLDAADEFARTFYRVRNQPERAEKVDSTRVRRGPGKTRIWSSP